MGAGARPGRMTVEMCLEEVGTSMAKAPESENLRAADPQPRKAQVSPYS